MAGKNPMRDLKAKEAELKRMATLVVAPIPLGRRKAVQGSAVGEQNVTDAELRWCTYGFLLASEWYRRQDVELPTKEYLQALAGMYGLKVPVLEIPAPSLEGSYVNG